MNDFTASNGITVADHGGRWDVTTIHFTGEVLGLPKHRTNERDIAFEDRDLLALREFFQAEADERLGRWRWPENPDYVVYPQEDGGAWVHAESEPGAIRYSGRVEAERQDAASTERLYVLAARAYFDAHSEPKPWHEAQPGEGWVIEIGDGDHENFQAVVVSNEGKFLYRDGGSTAVTSRWIRSGRRVHPEVTS